MIVGWFLAMRLAKQDGIPSEPAGQHLHVDGGLVDRGSAPARTASCSTPSSTAPSDIFKIWEGGLVAYGGMIGGFLASWYDCRKAGDPAAALGGRVGAVAWCWARPSPASAACCSAATTASAPTWPGRSTFPRAAPPGKITSQHLGLPQTDAAASLPVHPTQLYEMLAGLFLFGLLMFLRRVRAFSGQVFLGWVIGYGILRPIIEAYRDDDQRGSVGPLSTSQFIGLTSVVLGIGLLVVPDGSAIARIPRRCGCGSNPCRSPAHPRGRAGQGGQGDPGPPAGVRVRRASVAGAGDADQWYNTAPVEMGNDEPQTKQR